MSILDKQVIRQIVRAKIKELSHEERAEQSAQIFSTIVSLKEVEQASVIALFASLPDEPHTEAIIKKLAEKKRVVLPRIEGDNMEFYDICKGVCRGAFGIMEPMADEPIEPSKIDIMLVPGVAFTLSGERCGRGKGYYDKYLSRKGFRAYTIGVCYPCQIVDTLPTEPHDKQLDRVVHK